MTANRYEQEIQEIALYIQNQLHEPLSLSQLARFAGYSPYHFTRMFKAQMGISPFYYVSSLRLQKAKSLLLRTNFTIRDIGLEVGQQSLGTFTAQFTNRVGVTPSNFRKSAELAQDYFSSLHQFDQWALHQAQAGLLNRVEGKIDSEIPFQGFILVGLFPKPVPEGLPLYGTILSSLGNFCFTNVKPGTYYLMATSVSWGMQVNDFLLPEKILRFRSAEPIKVGNGVAVSLQRITLRHPLPDDPPILISIPLLMKTFLVQGSIPAIDKKSIF